MGVNILLVHRDNSEHSGWDLLRHPGDRDFAQLISKLPKIEEDRREARYSDDPTDTMYDAPLFRPADFLVWREEIEKIEWPEPERYKHFLSLLEDDPDLFVYLSY
jgi:hypothetical protein